MRRTLLGFLAGIVVGVGAALPAGKTLAPKTPKVEARTIAQELGLCTMVRTVTVNCPKGRETRP